MEKNFISRLPGIAIVAAVLFLSGCFGGPGNTGREVLPESDILRIISTDTLTVELESRMTDSINTYRAPRQMFGNYVDETFGRISMNTYTQVLPRSGLKFSDDTSALRFDSLVLTLILDNAYGDVESVQQLRIFELLEDFPPDSTVHSHSTIPFDDSRDLSQGFKVDFSGSKQFGSLRIRLDDELGRRILFANNDTLADKDLFSALFRGLRISTEDVNFFTREPGAIFSINATADESELTMYYQKRDTNSITFEPFEEPFIIIGATPRFTEIHRTETEGTFLEQQLPNPDTAQQYEFLQSGNLITNLVKFPSITGLGQVAVQLAELVINVDPSFLGADERYTPPLALLIIYADENGDPVEDENGIFVQVPVVANYDVENREYRIILTNYIQELVNGQRENNGLVIYPINSNVTPHRAVLGGAKHPDLAPKLDLTYSTLPE